MKSTLWLVAVACLVAWGLGLLGVGFFLALGGLVHVLLIIGIILVLYILVFMKESKS